MPHHNSDIQKGISLIGFPIEFSGSIHYVDGTNYFQSDIELTDDIECIREIVLRTERFLRFTISTCLIVSIHWH